MRINQDAILQNNYSYVPLRAVSGALGAEVAWDGATNSAFINFTEDDKIEKLVSDVSPIPIKKEKKTDCIAICL